MSAMRHHRSPCARPRRRYQCRTAAAPAVQCRMDPVRPAARSVTGGTWPPRARAHAPVDVRPDRPDGRSRAARRHRRLDRRSRPSASCSRRRSRGSARPTRRASCRPTWSRSRRAGSSAPRRSRPMPPSATATLVFFREGGLTAGRRRLPRRLRRLADRPGDPGRGPRPRARRHDRRHRSAARARDAQRGRHDRAGLRPPRRRRLPAGRERGGRRDPRARRRDRAGRARGPRDRVGRDRRRLRRLDRRGDRPDDDRHDPPRRPHPPRDLPGAAGRPRPAPDDRGRLPRSRAASSAGSPRRA